MKNTTKTTQTNIDEPTDKPIVIQIPAPRSLRNELKSAAAKKGLTMTEAGIEAIEAWVRRK